uniref:Uncharacterized protein n=1 Tax=Strigamia maritima TaxID=126957 RepID=T1J2Z5_STRMM
MAVVIDRINIRDFAISHSKKTNEWNQHHYRFVRSSNIPTALPAVVKHLHFKFLLIGLIIKIDQLTWAVRS